MKKRIVLCFGILVAMTAPLFSEGGGGDDEGEGSCYISVNGNTISNSEGRIVGCVSGGGNNCSYTITVPCP